MEDYRPIDRQFIDACREYPPDFIKIKRLLDQGADVNKVSADESVIGEILFSYPQIRDTNCRFAADCYAESCAGCKWNKTGADGQYLPPLMQFLLENGLDVTKCDGRVGAFALSELRFSDYDRYAIDVCKLLLTAGADPLVAPSAGDNESALTAIGFEGFFNSSENPKESVIDETMYRIMKAKSEGKDFAQIEHCDVCIGRRIDHIYLCANTERMKKIFPIWSLKFRHRNCFVNTVVLDCQGKMLCVDRYANVYVDPHVPRYARQTMDIAPRFKNCVGQTIVSINFSCHNLHRKVGFDGRSCPTLYTQPIILIKLSNGKTIRFSITYGEVPTEDMAAWFKVES